MKTLISPAGDPLHAPPAPAPEVGQWVSLLYLVQTTYGRYALRCSRLVAGAAVVLMTGGCDAAEAPTPIRVLDAADLAGSACSRENGARSRFEQTLRIEQNEEHSCRVVAVRAGIELEPSVDGSHPDPYMFSVARNRHGVFYTAATQASAPGTILMWGSDGSFMGRFGRPGEGPGELLGRSPGQLYVGRNDSIFVTEAGRMSIFGSDGTFGRLIDRPAIGLRYGQLALTDDGMFVSSTPVPGGDPDYWFHVADPEGNLIRSFGAIDEGSISRSRGRASPRAIAYAGGDRFWAAPPPGAPQGYVLEEWGLDGELTRLLRREVSWIEKGSRSADGGPVLPTFTVVADGEGLLWVTLIVKDQRWRPMNAEELRAAEYDGEIMSELYDIRYEVIDPSSGVLLASGLIDEFPGEDERNHPPIMRILPGTSISYRPRPDSLGLITIEFFNLRLMR